MYCEQLNTSANERRQVKLKLFVAEDVLRFTVLPAEMPLLVISDDAQSMNLKCQRAEAQQWRFTC